MQKYEKEKIIFGPMKVKKKKNIGTREGPKVLKKRDEHMKAHKKKKNDSHVSK